MNTKGLWGLSGIIYVNNWRRAWHTVGVYNVKVYDPRKSLKTLTQADINHLLFINSVAMLPSALIQLNTAEHLKHNTEFLSNADKMCLNEGCVLPVST